MLPAVPSLPRRATFTAAILVSCLTMTARATEEWSLDQLERSFPSRSYDLTEDWWDAYSKAGTPAAEATAPALDERAMESAPVQLTADRAVEEAAALSAEPLPFRLAPAHAYRPGYSEEVPSSVNPDAAPADPNAFPLYEVATAVVASVGTVTAWDKYGTALRTVCGFFANPDGAMMADASILGSDIAERIAYASIRTGMGTSYRVVGVLGFDADLNVALLETDAEGVPPLPLARADFSRPEVAIVARRPNGLTLADAIISLDSRMGGKSWFRITGKDSPGYTGSPVLNAKGAVIGIVTMYVPEVAWMDFGVLLEEAGALLKALPLDAKAMPLEEFARRRQPQIEGDARFAEAFIAAQEGRYRSALLALEGVAKRFPNASEVFGLIGYCHSRMGDEEKALNSYRKALALDPQSPELWYRMALRHRKAENWDAAKDALRRAAADRPRDSVSWYLYGEICTLHGDYAEGARALAWAVAAGSEYSGARYLLAVSLAKSGQTGTAGQVLRQLLSRHPSHVKGWYLLGLVLQEEADLRPAIQAFRKVVALEPSHPSAWMNLARACERLGDRHDARLALRKHAQL